MAAGKPIDIDNYRHTGHAKPKWTGPADHPSDLGESQDAHLEYTLRPEEFFIPPADAQGRCVQITVRLQPQLLRAISAVRDSDNSPYSTINDLVRHALHRHVRWYYAIHADLRPTYFSVWKIALEACRDSNYLSDTADNWRFIDERVKRLVDNGDMQDARVELVRTKKLFEALPESPARREVLANIHNKYSHILHGTPHKS
jgi:hypothetical protein